MHHAAGCVSPALRLELREQPVDVVDVPGALDLRDHDHVELVADLAHERVRSSRHHGLVEAVDAGPELACRRSRPRAPIFTSPSRAATLLSAGIASSRLPSRTSHFLAISGTFDAIFGLLGSKKWIMREGLNGISRSGAGAPSASGLKKSFALAHRAAPSRSARALVELHDLHRAGRRGLAGRGRRARTRRDSPRRSAAPPSAPRRRCRRGRPRRASSRARARARRSASTRTSMNMPAMPLS